MQRHLPSFCPCAPLSCPGDWARAWQWQAGISTQDAPLGQRLDAPRGGQRASSAPPAFLCSGAGVLAALRPRCAAHPAGGGPGERRGVGARPQSGAEACWAEFGALRSPGAGWPEARAGVSPGHRLQRRWASGQCSLRQTQPGADSTPEHR